MSFNFDEFMERLKDAPDFVKENVMCYFYHNTSACRDCLEEDCKTREPRQILSVAETEKQGGFKSQQKAKDIHVELPETLPEFLKEKPTSPLTEVHKHMMERILDFARAGHHKRVYTVTEFTHTDKPGAVRWNLHLFGYGARGVAFKLAKRLHETVQMYDFGAPL